MASVLLVARLVLAVVFGVAGLGKLIDSKGSRRAMEDFGLPRALAQPAGALLPLAELAVAVALVPTRSAWWGALGALVLLVLFMAAIAANLARGRRPDCHCFGQVASGPIGRSTLVRNAVLAGLAGFVIWQGQSDAGRGAAGWLRDLTGAERLVLAVALVGIALALGQAWVLVQLVRQNGRLLLRLEAVEAGLGNGLDGVHGLAAPPSAVPAAGLPVGTPAPAFALPDIDGEEHSLEELTTAGKPLLLVFSDPGCGPCTALLPEVAGWQRQHAAWVTVAVISRGTPDENRAKRDEHELFHFLLQQDREVAEAYRVPGTPSAVLVWGNRTIASPLAAGVESITALVAQAVPAVQAAVGAAANGQPATIPLITLPGAGAIANGQTPCPNCGKVHANGAAQAAPAGPPVGAPAPALKLPDLAGRTVDLADYRGRETLLVFWNPGCGFCQQLLPEIKAWEADRPPRAPALLVVSAGGAPENAALGFASTVVLDPTFAVAASFGAGGTPSAVLVDAAGQIASPVAVGGPAVMGLARPEPARP